MSRTSNEGLALKALEIVCNGNKIPQSILCIEYLISLTNAIVSYRLALLNKKIVKDVSFFPKVRN